MTGDPGALLAGPRGRRLCLELAVAAAERAGTPAGDEYRLAVAHAAYDLDPGRGTARVMVSAGLGGPAVPRRSPADVARLLDAVVLDTPDEPALLRALAAAVDNARYWQEPDGEDVLAASPVVSEALLRVAAQVSGSARAGWWTTPLDRPAQWTVTPRGGAAPAAAWGTVAERLARWRAATVREEAAAGRERPRDPRARWSGTWWSTPPADLLRTTRGLAELGPVGLWLVEDSPGWESARTRPVPAAENARVYELDGPEAWAELCRRYPLEVTAARRHDWYRVTGCDSRWVVPDWSRAAGDLDAVHLSVTGYLTTAGRAVDLGNDRRTVLAGWDPDQTVWLTDSVAPGPPEQTWRRDDDGGWRRVEP